MSEEHIKKEWLDEAIIEEIRILSRNAGAKKALSQLVKTPEYTRILKEHLKFPKVNLKSYEYRIIYEICCDEDVDLFASTMRLIDYLDPGMVHGNLESDRPIKIIKEPFKLPEDERMAKQYLNTLKKDFEERYKKANSYL